IRQLCCRPSRWLVRRRSSRSRWALQSRERLIVSDLVLNSPNGYLASVRLCKDTEPGRIRSEVSIPVWAHCPCCKKEILGQISIFLISDSLTPNSDVFSVSSTEVSVLARSDSENSESLDQSLKPDSKQLPTATLPYPYTLRRHR